MRNYGLTFAWIGALVAAALIGIGSFGLKKGIDLSGGTILVYQVKSDGRAGGGDHMDELIASLQRRVNPEGVEDIPIRKVGNNRVEIILANRSVEEVERLKRKMTDVGSLVFRILANEKKDGARGTGAVARAQAAPINRPPAGYDWAKLGEIVTGTSPKIAGPASIRDEAQSWRRDRYKDRAQVTLTGLDSTGREVTRNLEVASNAENTLVFKQPHNLRSVAGYRLEYNPGRVGQRDIEAGEAIVRDVPAGGGRTDRYVLVKLDRWNVTGDYLARTYPTQDERVQPAVGFVFNAQGARKFGALTGAHLPEEDGAFKYRLAVVLDNVVQSAPSINSRITDSGIIEGMPVDEVSYLIDILRSGSLPASIDPTPLLEEKIGPTLGQDTIQKGLRAIAVSMLVVPIFMIAYYRFAGLVAVVALVLNMLFLVASMAVTGSSFTLPGLAGLALTIGMAVDANVLIFERMREEKERGAGLAQQIRMGFDKAWSTIFDSNVTTILSGAILWWVGTQEIKGFALTLIIGLVWNLFTAVYLSRVIFDFWYSKGWLKKLTMIKVLDRTQIDFIGPRRVLMACSAVAIALGLVAFFIKGERIYNIDFTGGTLVTLRLDPNAGAVRGLNEARRAAYVRETAARALQRDVSVETLNVGGENAGTRFNIRTTDEDVRRVQQRILEAFQPTLAKIETKIGPPEPIPAAPAGDAGKAAGSDPAKPAEGKAAGTADRFAGGSQFTLTFNRPVEPSTVQDQFQGVLAAAKVAAPERRFEVVAPRRPATAGGAETLTIRTDLDPQEAQEDLNSLASALQLNTSLAFDRVENFGGAVASEARSLAAVAIVASWLVIIAYLWFRFQSMAFGLAAVVALVHDVLIALGAVAVSPYKIDLPMVAAFLTLIGFSVNDTIVIFDRIREIRGKTPYLTPQIINAAINQTLSRTILTSLTAWLVVLILYLFGGEGLRGFSFCLVIGFLSGTYSTVYIAAPILIEWLNKKDDVRSKAKPVAAEV